MQAYILSLSTEAHLKKQWDFGIVKDLLDGKLWQTPDWLGFKIENVKNLPKIDRAIVCIAARHHKGLEVDVNKQLKKIDRVVLFLMGDEEADFDIDKIDHDNIQIWVQNPHLGKHDNYNKIGTGYPAHIKEYMPAEIDKYRDLFFAGQITHSRRDEMIEALEFEPIDNSIVIRTGGFTQGETHEDYYNYMLSAKIAPAPSGAVIPDSFRLFEALECMAIPIADQKLPSDEIWEYWDWLFGEIVPFPRITNWFAINEIVEDTLINYPNNMHKQTEWWIKWKRKFVYKVIEQLNA